MMTMMLLITTDDDDDDVGDHNYNDKIDGDRDAAAAANNG